MAGQTTQRHGPTAAERATARLIAGLLLALATPFLAPAGLVALWVGVSLARAGHRRHAAAVLVAAAVALAVVVAQALDQGPVV